MLVQIVNIPKSISILHIPSILFCRCIDIPPDWAYLDTHLISFLQSCPLIDPLGTEEVFVSIFLSIGHLSAINDIIQGRLNSVVDIIESFALLVAGLDIVTKLVAEVALATVVCQVAVDCCRFSDLPFLWSMLGSGSNCCSSVVAWFRL